LSVQEINGILPKQVQDYSSSGKKILLKIWVIFQLNQPTRYSKPEVATAVVVAPDDGHEDARNMLSCI
jgi:hypothetical protein